MWKILTKDGIYILNIYLCVCVRNREKGSGVWKRERRDFAYEKKDHGYGKKRIGILHLREKEKWLCVSEPVLI